MGKFLTSLLLIFIVYCGPSTDAKLPINNLDALEQKTSLYINLAKKHQDVAGFIMTDRCDSLLFSALYASAVPSLHIDILQARHDGENNRWVRRPKGDCGPAYQNSKSTISKDMLLGLLWWMWSSKNLEAADSLMQTLQQTNYVLPGEGTVGELVVTPSLLSTLAEIIYRLGGHDYTAERLLPAVFTPNVIGFESHLMVWHILLRGEIFKGISTANFNILKHRAVEQPKNPFYQAAYHRYLDGDYTNVIKLLMDEDEWPADRLPTSHNHCEPWPIQRDYSPRDWGSCDPLSEWIGAEVPVILYLIIKSSGGVADGPK